jgi:hypothetical protein
MVWSMSAEAPEALAALQDAVAKMPGVKEVIPGVLIGRDGTWRHERIKAVFDGPR